MKKLPYYSIQVLVYLEVYRYSSDAFVMIEL